MRPLDDAPGPVDGRDDLARAVAGLAERLPPALAPLARVAFNYRWCWLPDGDAFFNDLDTSLWRRTGGNPRRLLETLPPQQLRQLASDDALVARARALGAALDADLARPPFAGPVRPDRPVAYFCSEFAVHESLPLYGGGLGVLAGDLLKAASDLALPMLGVGLLYREGYFRQRIDIEGWQREYWVPTSFEHTPAVLVRAGAGRPVTVAVPLRGRTVHIQAWRVQVGRVPLFLLDTDVEDNDPIDRWITARLYIGDRHTRLAQYAVLGVGGVRMLAALGIVPGLVHLNEGHAALSGLERVRTRLARRTFGEAFAEVRATTVFTTHTPVGAGNEWYAIDEVEPVLGAYADTLGIERRRLYDLSRMAPGDEAARVAITPVALRLSRSANAVSRRHGEVARAMWHPLWPDRTQAEVPIEHVTNGIHTATWMARPMQALLDRRLAPDWRARLGDVALWERLATVPDEELWSVRSSLRAALVERARVQSVRDRLGRGEPPEYVEAAARVFDPAALTVGFARRVATYKRLHLLLRQLDRGIALLGDTSRPVQMVIAGKAHPQDVEAKHTLQALFAARRAPHVGARIVFLDDYDLELAAVIVAGVDVWLNVPRPPQEASGTSGMKVAVNGGLNLSVLDGWWLEAFDPALGWAIATPEADPGVQDDHDAAALFDCLEREVVPLFYARDAAGVPREWLARVKTSLARLIPRFSAERMLRDYAERLYAVPAESP